MQQSGQGLDTDTNVVRSTSSCPFTAPFRKGARQDPALSAPAAAQLGFPPPGFFYRTAVWRSPCVLPYWAEALHAAMAATMIFRATQLSYASLLPATCLRPEPHLLSCLRKVSGSECMDPIVYELNRWKGDASRSAAVV